MLFAKPFELQNLMPWFVIVLATVMLAAIIGKCISIYRKLKKNRAYVKRNGEVISKTVAIRGEYFVLASGVEYLVGENGQLKCGKYLLRGDGYDDFQLSVNGECSEHTGDSSVELCDGDVVQPTACDVLIKPITDTMEQV